MSSTIFKEAGFRFFFFSREEPRMHIHVQCGSGEAKFWLEPNLDLARNQGLNEKELGKARILIEERIDEIRSAWRNHFPG